MNPLGSALGAAGRALDDRGTLHWHRHVGQPMAWGAPNGSVDNPLRRYETCTVAHCGRVRQPLVGELALVPGL